MALYFIIVIGMIIVSLWLNKKLDEQEETKMFGKALWSNLVKAIELALVLVFAYLVCFITMGVLYGNIYIGIAAVAIVYYYFSEMIRPYFRELRSKILKEKKEEE